MDTDKQLNRINGSVLRNMPGERYWHLYLGIAAVAVSLVALSNVFFWVPLRITAVQVGVLLALGGLALRNGMRMRWAYYSPLILAVLYIVGYPMRVADMELAPQRWTPLDYGNFAFTHEAYWSFVMVVTIGMCGLMAGQYLASARGSKKRVVRFHVIPIRFTLWICIWAALMLANTIINMRYSIGTLTTYPVALSFHITGLLNVNRTYVLPLIGLWLFGLALERGKIKPATTLLVINFAFGMLGIIATLSKVAVIGTLAPYILCMAMNNRKFAIAPILLRKVLLGLVIIAPVSIIAANVLRYYSLLNGEVRGISEVVSNTDISAARAENPVVFELYHSTFLRILGGNELMALMEVEKIPLHSLIPIATNENKDGMGDIVYQGFNINITTMPGQGRATGLFGFWCLTGSLWVLFGVTALCGAAMIGAERIIGPFGNSGLSAGVGFLIAMPFWEFTPDMIPLLAVALFVVYMFLRLFCYRRATTADLPPVDSQKSSVRTNNSPPHLHISINRQIG